MIWTTEHLHIFKVDGDCLLDDGYYFEDESCGEHGPYPDYATALYEFERYCKECL